MLAATLYVSVHAETAAPALPQPVQRSVPIAPEHIFARFSEDCTTDAGRLWGVSLCGPFLVMTESGHVFANSADA